LAPQEAEQQASYNDSLIWDSSFSLHNTVK